MMSVKRSVGAESRWQALIAEQEASGLGIAQFAARRGVNPTSLYWWRSRLRRRECEKPRLVPIEVIDAAHRSSASSVFELDLGGGRRLRVPHGFDEGELARLIKTLDRVC